MVVTYIPSAHRTVLLRVVSGANCLEMQGLTPTKSDICLFTRSPGDSYSHESLRNTTKNA